MVLTLWNEKDRKILMYRLEDTNFAKDADGVHSFVNTLYRTKTYVKDYDYFTQERSREFPEPYQVAAKYYGGNWNDYNAPIAVMIPRCNLDCYWCFYNMKILKDEDAVYITAKELIDQCIGNQRRKALRLTGGEPFLATEFMLDLARELKKLDQQIYLWIDTNLLGDKYSETVRELVTLDMPFGINGCFKGFNGDHFTHNTRRNPALLLKQFENASKILSEIKCGNKGELFFYVPEFIEKMHRKDIQKNIAEFMDLQISKISENAPLRTTVIGIKEYSSNEPEMPKTRLKTGETRKIWNKELKTRYSDELLWIPSNQVVL